MSEEPVDGWSGLIDTARRVGHHVWIERRLFEWLGAWSTVEGVDPATTRYFGESAARHGRHAGALFERLPELRELQPEELVVPADDAAATVVTHLVPAAEPDRSTEALVDHARVLLPTLVASYRALAAGASPVSDAALIRSLGVVLDEHVEEWVRGDALLRGRLVRPDDLRRALDRQWESEARSSGFEGSRN